MPGAVLSTWEIMEGANSKANTDNLFILVQVTPANKWQSQNLIPDLSRIQRCFMLILFFIPNNTPLNEQRRFNYKCSNL